MTETYQMKTINNYDFFECASSFQKAIRRGDEDNALFWAVELYLSNYAEYAWKRIMIMSSEDIGLSNPNIVSQIWSLYSMYSHLAKKKDSKHEPQRLQFIQAVLLLTRSPKSRIVDWALIHAFRKHNDNLLEPMDVALDKHTRKGKAMGRGFDHFFKEGCKLENHIPQDREQEYMDSSEKILVEKQTTDLFGDPVDEE